MISLKMDNASARNRTFRLLHPMLILRDLESALAGRNPTNSLRGKLDEKRQV